MKKLITAVILMFCTMTTTAEPTGSLRAMMDTQITLIEYLKLQVQIDSLLGVVKDEKRQWGTEFGLYESIVERNLKFDYDADRLIYHVIPIDEPTFKSMKEAKAYCRALIVSQRRDVWVRSLFNSTPEGWGNSRINADDYEKGVFEHSIIQNYIPQKRIEDSEEGLFCKANLNGEGEIKSWSFSI